MRKPGVHNTLPRVNRRIAPLASGWIPIASALVMVLALVQPASAERRIRRSDIVDVCAGEPGIKLVTMGVGSLIWERHGHIALCSCSPDLRENACYNYGIGDFHDPLNMVWGFFRGTDSFWVGKQDPLGMIYVYQNADRTVWVQDLPLSGEQQENILRKLEFDIREENKHYSYDHFWDNCTTRVRDILDEATGGALSSMKMPTDGRTYRDLAREGFYGMRIPLLATDFAMGRVTDREPTYYERMFLPDYLREAVRVKWGAEPRVVYERKGPPPAKDGPSGRILLTLVFLALTAPAWLSRLFGRFQRTGMWIAVLPPVLFGLVFWFLAIISPLPYVRWNETCLALVPFDLLLVLLSARARTLYARGRVVMLGLVALLLVIGVLKAPIWPAVVWTLVPNAVAGFWPARWTGLLTRSVPGAAANGTQAA